MVEHPYPRTTVTIPQMDPHSLRQATKGQGRVQAMLRQLDAHIACLQVSGLSKTKLSYVIRLWKVDGTSLQKMHCPLPRIQVEEIVGQFAGMARSLASRYPGNSRPDTLVIGSDGLSLMFNPARLSGGNAEWLRDHLTGKAPAAILIKQESLLARLAQQ